MTKLKRITELFQKQTTTKSDKERLNLIFDPTTTGAIWKNIPNGHKWIDYFERYEQEFSYFINKTNVKILELGVYKGASLKIWKKFFAANSTVFGINIDKNCLACEDNSIYIKVGRQEDNDFVSFILEKNGNFDITNISHMIYIIKFFTWVCVIDKKYSFSNNCSPLS